MLSLFIPSLIFLTITGIGGLKITKLSVPEVVDVRDSAVLSCEFDLENSKLYSVKWYKNDLEFCRFMPNSTPEVQIFTVEGINLNTKQCNRTTVTLHPLNFSTSGIFSCEVSTEAPYFKTVQVVSNMTVMAIPGKDPVISGIKEIYAVGDYVEGNCTSDASRPFATLHWYINDNRVESWQLEEYPNKDERNPLGLQHAILGIHFQVDHSHFSGKGNTMFLKCVARVLNLSKQAVRISRLADLDVEKFAQGLYGNEGSRVDQNLVAAFLFLKFIIEKF